jgi:hypothetical protein
MIRRSSGMVFLFFLGSSAVAGAYGCAHVTGIPVSQRVTEFWQKDVVPLWRYGVKADPPPPTRLDGWPSDRPQQQAGVAKADGGNPSR